jgi:hypothetical protein
VQAVLVSDSADGWCNDAITTIREVLPARNITTLEWIQMSAAPGNSELSGYINLIKRTGRSET